MVFLKKLSAILPIALISTSALAVSDAQVFAFAAANYPSLFSGAATTGTYQNYNYRYFPATGNYLAVNAGAVYIMGPLTGGSISSVGTVSTFTSAITNWQATHSTVQYYDFNYLQNVNGIPSSTASILDNGANIGLLTFGPSGITSNFLSTNAGADYNWGSAVSYASGFESNPNDTNVPASAMICQVADVGDGTMGNKSTDVLVTKSAVAITNAASLAGLAFTSYREDCTTKNGSSASFDASGNATFISSGGKFISSGGTINFTASQFTSILAGVPTTIGGGNITFNAYSYQTELGGTKYVLVEHGGTTSTGLKRGYVGIWRQ